MKVVQEPTRWRDFEAVRRAGICSYGSVSHALIEEFPENREKFAAPRYVNGKTKDEMTVLLLSAPQEKRLVPQAEAFSSWVLGDGMIHSLSSIATTLATRRGHHDYRSAFIVNSY